MFPIPQSSLRGTCEVKPGPQPLIDSGRSPLLYISYFPGPGVSGNLGSALDGEEEPKPKGTAFRFESCERAFVCERIVLFAVFGMVEELDVIYIQKKKKKNEFFIACVR